MGNKRHTPTRRYDGESSQTRKLWRDTPWAWEFEILTFLILGLGLFFCTRYEMQNIPAYAKTAEVIELDTARSVWAMLSVLAYVGHLLMSRVALRDVSTPFHLMVSPLLFALLGFFNYRSAFIRVHGMANWEFPLQGFLFLIGGIMAMSLLLARVRMMRVMLPFRDMRWQLDVAPQKGRIEKMVELMLRVHPLIYPPVRYRANASGIEIEGLFYVTLVSYREMRSISLHGRGDMFSSGVFLTHTMENLVRIHLKTRKEPIVIGPKNPEVFVEFTRRMFHEFEGVHTISRTTGRG